jgi:hypothetical protein
MTTNYTKGPQTIPNFHKLFQMAVKYFKWSQNIQIWSFLRLNKIYPNSDLWFEKNIWQPCSGTVFASNFTFNKMNKNIYLSSSIDM